MSWIKIVKLNSKNGEVVPEIIDNNKESFLKALGSKRIKDKDVEISEYKVGNKNYSIVYRKSNQSSKKSKQYKNVSAVSKNGRVELQGNLVIANADDNGRACSLTDADIDNILDHKVNYLVPKPLSCFTSIQLDMIDNAFTRAYHQYVGM